MLRRRVRSNIVVPASLLNLSFATAREFRAEGCFCRTALPAAWFEKDNRCLYLWFQMLADKVESGEHKDLTAGQVAVVTKWADQYM